WRFYNPTTQHFIISSHIVFDEHVFPGNTTTPVNPFGDLQFKKNTNNGSGSDTAIPETVSHQGGENLHSNDTPLSPPLQSENSPELPSTPPGLPLTPLPSPQPSPPTFQLPRAKFEL
ncbi:hypothetical protein ARMGADRAFT_941371, partial [Armillaria gallica]